MGWLEGFEGSRVTVPLERGFSITHPPAEKMFVNDEFGNFVPGKMQGTHLVLH